MKNQFQHRSFLPLIFFTISLWIHPISVQAFENKKVSQSDISQREHFALKIGPSTGWAKMGAIESTQDSRAIGGLHTQLGYQRGRFELSASSYLGFTSFKGLSFQTQKKGKITNSSGRYRSLAITPTIKYFPRFGKFNSFHFYFGGGVVWSQRSMRISNAQKIIEDHDFPKEKLSYESRGGIIQLGIEQLLAEKKHPLFLELALIYSESRKVALVDANNFRKTEILSKESAVNDVQNYQVLISFGVTLF